MFFFCVRKFDVFPFSFKKFCWLRLCILVGSFLLRGWKKNGRYSFIHFWSLFWIHWFEVSYFQVSFEISLWISNQIFETDGEHEDARKKLWLKVWERNIPFTFLVVMIHKQNIINLPKISNIFGKTRLMEKNGHISKRAKRPFFQIENVVSDHVKTFGSQPEVLEPLNGSNRWLRNFRKDP